MLSTLENLNYKYYNNITIILTGLRRTGKSTTITEFKKLFVNDLVLSVSERCYNYKYKTRLLRRFYKNLRFYSIVDRYYFIDHYLCIKKFKRKRIIKELKKVKKLVGTNKLYFGVFLNQQYNNSGDSKFGEKYLTKERIEKFVELLDELNIQYIIKR